MIKPRIGVSACLLGHKVRYDGDHQAQAWLIKNLSPWVQWVPLCPEVEMGLGVPRETIRLIKKGQSIRLRTSQTRQDITPLAHRTSRNLLKKLGPVDAFILKKNSPSCGLRGVKVYLNEVDFKRSGTGVFAQALKKKHPKLLIFEEEALSDPPHQQQAWIQILAKAQWRTFVLESKGKKIARLQNFHRRNKYLLLASHPHLYRSLGPLAARGAVRTYETAVHQALQSRPSRANLFNSFQHMGGFFKNKLNAAAKTRLHTLLSQYHQGAISEKKVLSYLYRLAEQNQETLLLEQSLFEAFIGPSTHA